MKSPRCTITLAYDLRDATELRRTSLRYRSLAEYLVGLARIDVAEQLSHERAFEWAAMPPRFRDEVDAKLLDIQRKGAALPQAKKATNPAVEISDDVLDLLTSFAAKRGLPLEEAANEVLARFLYAGSLVA